MQECKIDEQCGHCGYLPDSGPKSLQHLPPGIVLAEKYLIGTALGQGGFGITYLAWDINLGIKLAIKEYFPQGMLSRAPGQTDVETYSYSAREQFSFGLERFLNEAKTLAQYFEHPNIVTVRDFFRANGTAYMVMNYVEGITLDGYQRASGGRLPYEQAVTIMMPVLDALKEVHRSGFLHRDISPDNIFIDTRGRVTLIDFGAARQEMQQNSRGLSVIMKVGYSPEEQYRSNGAQGPWTDIYAVAATFYRLITGEMPPESMDRLAEDSLVIPSRLDIKLDTSVEKALLKALAVRSQDRYQSIDEFQTALMGGRKTSVTGADDQVVLQNGVSSEVNQSDNHKDEATISAKSMESSLDKEASISKKNRTGIFTVVGIAAALLLFIGGTSFFGDFAGAGVGTDQEEFSPDAAIGSDRDVETGKINWDSGEYEGELKENVPHGYGIWLADSGDWYEGEWKDGLYHGQGIFIWGEEAKYPGAKYEGGFVDSMPHGYGIISWSNGDSYEGEWVETEMTGWGTYIYGDGYKYTGDHLRGKAHGQGTGAWPNGDTYRGEWVDDAMSGYGTYTWADGATYVGEFINNSMHGQGTLTEPDGTKIAGVWKDGELIEEEIDSNVSSLPVEEIAEGNNDNVTEEIEENDGQKFIGTIYNNSDKKMIFYINDSPIAILQPQSSIRAVLPYGYANVKAREDTLSNEQGVYIERTKFIDGPEWTITFVDRRY